MRRSTKKPRRTRRRYKSQEIELNIYLRKCLSKTTWRTACLRKYGNACAVTGRYLRGRLHVHHVISHAEIRDAVLSALGLALAHKLSDYTKEELEQITFNYIEIHSSAEGIPLLKTVHKLFHKLYGNHTTKLQFMEFKARFDAGEFGGIIK